MKKYIGKKVEFVVEGFPGPFTATVVGETQSTIEVHGEDDLSRFIIKSKVSSYKPLEGVQDDNVNLLVLFCENPSIKCPGVQCVKAGDGFNKADLDAFMLPCPSRCTSCRTGSKGELRTVNGDFLKTMLNGTMFGDYPEKK